MRLATVEEARRIDSRSQTEFGLSSELLMEAAGALSAHEIIQSYFNETRRRSILVVCGPGHNGADGLVVARHLKSAGANVEVAMLGAEDSYSPLYKIQMSRALQAGVVAVHERVSGSLDRAGLIVDAVFGIGLSRPVEGAMMDLIRKLNSCTAPVVSLDVPSGLDANRGVALGIAVKADLTITFGLAKPGFFVSQGPELVGRLRILPIGFPKALVKEESKTHRLVTASVARRLLPTRSAQSNKSNHGRAGLIGGRPGLAGALLLAAHSASRSGAGYVIAASFCDPREIVGPAPEFMTADANDSDFISKARFSAVGLGPGLGASDSTSELISQLYQSGLDSVVLDADALTNLANKRQPLRPSWILTPHAGELSRLIGREAKAIESDRFQACQAAAKEWGTIVLLKGFRTVISDGEKTAVVMAGNSSLAKAGSGDVLTGLITGLMAQGVRPFAAACLGSYLHGRLADEWVKSGRDRISLEAGDIAEALPLIIRRVRDGALS